MKLINYAGFDVLQADKEMCWEEAVAFPDIANSEKVGGFNDWALPDVDTLMELKIISRKKKGDFWSSSTSFDSNDAWYVDFFSGIGFDGYKSGYCMVRLVRASQCSAILEAGKQKVISLSVQHTRRYRMSSR